MKINSLKLIGIMNDRGLSCKELAELAGVDPSKISRARNGKEGCSFENLLKITTALGIDFFELVPPEVRCYR